MFPNLIPVSQVMRDKLKQPGQGKNLVAGTKAHGAVGSARCRRVGGYRTGSVLSRIQGGTVGYIYMGYIYIYGLYIYIL